MQNILKLTPVQAAVKTVVGRSLMSRQAIKARLSRFFSANEIDAAIDTTLSQVRVKIIRD